MHHSKLASIQMVAWNILKKYNIDPDPIFKRSKLNPSLMYKQGERYHLDNIAILWDEMEKSIKDPCFGLNAASCWHPSHFGTLAYVMLMSNSLRITLERLIRFHEVISGADFGELLEDGKEKSFSMVLKYQDENPYPAGREDAAISWIMSLLRINFQHNLSPAAVFFTHKKPPCVGKYYEFFQSPVHFNSTSCQLILPLDIVDQTLLNSNEELASFSEHTMSIYIKSLNTVDQRHQVKEIITDNLPSGNVTVEMVAASMGMNKRKLQRLLRAQGTTFIDLLNETRMELAKQFIHKEPVDLTEVAFMLGFSELSTFSRSFKRWTGQSPMQYKKAV